MYCDCFVVIQFSNHFQLHPSVVGPASLPLLFSVYGLLGSSDSVCNHYLLSSRFRNKSTSCACQLKDSVAYNSLYAGIFISVIMSVVLSNGQMNLSTGFWLFRKKYCLPA